MMKDFPVHVAVNYYPRSQYPALAVASPVVRTRSRLVNGTATIVSRIPVANPVLTYAFDTLTDASISPVGECLTGGEQGFSSIVTTEVEDTYRVNYFQWYNVNHVQETYFGQVYDYYYHASEAALLVGSIVRIIEGSVSADKVVLRVTATQDYTGNSPYDSFQNGSTPPTVSAIFHFPATGEMREATSLIGVFYPPSSFTAGLLATLEIPVAQAKALPKSGQPIRVRFINRDFLSTWVPVRVAPFASALPHQLPESETFTVDTSGSYDLDDGIVSSQFFLKNGAARVNITALATQTPEQQTAEVVAFSWQSLADATGITFTEGATISFDFVVTDAGGLSDTVTFSVIAPAISVATIGAVQLANKRLVFLTQEGKDVKTRVGQFDANGALKLTLTNTMQNVSNPALASRRDGSLLRSTRNSDGAIVLERSADEGKTWQ